MELTRDGYENRLWSGPLGMPPLAMLQIGSHANRDEHFWGIVKGKRRLILRAQELNLAAKSPAWRGADQGHHVGNP